MKIDNSTKNITSIVRNDVQRNTSASRSPASANGGVHLNSASTRSQAIDKTPADNAVVDTARVAEIKQAISEGRFKVNPEAVADRLLETVRELIQSKKG